MSAEGHPRHWRRVRGLSASGFAVRTAGYVRGASSVRDATADAYDLMLGRLHRRNYASRSLVLLRGLRRLRRIVRRSDVVYCFGMDVAALAFLATLGSPIALVLEVGDIRRVQLASGFGGRLYRALERIVVRRVSLLVVTSPAFATEYFASLQGLGSVTERTVVMNNWPERAHDGRSDQSRIDGPSERRTRHLTIGWFGLLRCPTTLQLLCRWAAEAPERRVVLAGRLQLSASETDLRHLPGVTYRGPYANPKDLPQLYGSVDLVWAAYPLDEEVPGNWQWARTNRFFEACAYDVPPITRSNTPDGRASQTYSLGPVLGDVPAQISIDALVRQLDEVDAATSLTAWRANVARYRELKDTSRSDHGRLARRITASLPKGSA